MAFKIVQCPECGSGKFPKFLEVEKACGKFECGNEECKFVWWGKSCQHRKVSKADVQNEVERLKKNNQFI
jgi:hypothetical protein